MLGSRKLLIFGIVSALVLSLLIVGAFAAEPEDLKSLPVLRHPANDNYPVSLFRTTYRYYTNSNNQPTQMTSATEDNPVYVHYIYFADLDGNVVQEERESDVPFWIGSLPGAGQLFDIHFGDDVYQIKNHQFRGDIISFSPITHNFGPYWTKETLSARFFILPLLESLLSIGTSLVSFVVSRPIVLIPIVAMILVLSYGVIRRLIKGV